MKNEDETLGRFERTTKAEIWMLIAEGWRAVTFAEQAAGGGGGLEEAPSSLDDVESRLHRLEAELLSREKALNVRVWSLERCEIEDLVFEIVHNARPHVKEAVEHYAERDRSEAQAQAEAEAEARSYGPETVN